jgi:hypothetical protein
MTDPRHERDRRDERPVAVGADDVLGPEPVLDRHHRGARKQSGQASSRRVQVRRLRGQDGQVDIGQISGIRRRRDRRRELALARDPEAALRERQRVILTSREHPDVRHLREMGRVEAADHPRSNDADALDRHAENLLR